MREGGNHIPHIATGLFEPLLFTIALDCVGTIAITINRPPADLKVHCTASLAAPTRPSLH